MSPRFLWSLSLVCALAFPTPAFAASVLVVNDVAAPDPVEEADDTLDFSSLEWRHGQLQLHQAFGLGTLASMAVTGGLGYWLSRQNGNSGVFDGHLLLAGVTSGLYLTSATLALTSPPSPLKRSEGPWDTTGIHRNLAWLHAAGILTTVGLGLLSTYSSLQYSPYYGYAAYGTVGLMALSAGVIAFGP